MLNAPKNSVIILDNASFHKRSDARDVIEKARHTLEFLPPHSPDLNPIERKWAQAKSIRQKFDHNTYALFIYANL